MKVVLEVNQVVNVEVDEELRGTGLCYAVA